MVFANFRRTAVNESRVLVIYTGGTIGMLAGNKGYSPLSGYLSQYLRSQPRFHDPQSLSLGSNSRSVDAFHSWQSLVSLASATSSADSAISRDDSATLTNGLDKEASLNSNRLKVVTPKGPQWLESLVMPENNECPQIRYAILEFERLMDSAEIQTSDYLDICDAIQSNYELFDSFIILHGTDTMAYTASALSFLLENLGKTVILTGAQIPLSCPRNDAVDNLLGSLQISGSSVIPEVSLYFNHRLWRGNRTMKISTVEFDAFRSFNLDPLVRVGCSFEVRGDLVLKPAEGDSFQVHQKMCENVAVLRMFPGITVSTIRGFLAPPIQGVVLETFGSGNAPRTAPLLAAFKEASARGVVIVNITQCLRGTVASDIYETGRALLEVGVIGGRDMTTECALAKLGYLLSKPGLSLQDVRCLIGQPLRGELSPAARTSH